MSIIKAIVCGTTFGQIYLDALSRSKDFALAGILSGDSERSELTAQKYNTVLYKNIDELPDDIQVAFVVIRSSCLGGVGTDIARGLLERGVNVMQEHPVHYKDIEELAKIAHKNKKIYLVGNLYKHSKHVHEFIKCTKKLNDVNELLYIKAAFSSQMSYSAMEIMLNALPAGVGLELQETMDCGGFKILNGTLRGVPFTFEIHHEINPKDPNNNMNFMHEIEFVYAAGRLMLSNTFGPLLWFPKMNTQLSYAIDRNYPEHMLEDSGIVIGSYGDAFNDILDDIWPEAVLKDMEIMANTLQNRGAFGKNLQKEITVAKLWNEITSAIGYARIVDRTVYEPFKATELEKLIQEDY